MGTSTLAQQHTTLRNEVLEETDIDIKGIPVGHPVRSFAYSYAIDGITRVRNVHQFVVSLPEKEGEYPVTINRTRRADGRPEDHHGKYKWVDAKEYKDMLDNNEIADSSTVLAIL